MADPISGKTGTVDGACNEISKWEVTLTTDMLDATDFCSGGWKKYVAGLQGATGSIASTTRYVGTSSITLSNSAGGVSIAGDVLWHEEGISNDVKELQGYTQSFTFTGEVIVT